MKENKFRGRTLDDGNWVYGHHVEFIALTGEGSLKGQITLDNQTKVSCIVDSIGCVHIVKPETIGQYINLNDKNDKGIYDGDYCIDEDGDKYVVEYSQDYGTYVFRVYGRTYYIGENDQEIYHEEDWVESLDSYMPLRSWFEVNGDIHEVI